MSTLVTNNIQNLAGTASTSADNVINGSAKAWVNFGGVTTVSIRGSYNVSSVTRNTTGTYTINFTNAFSNTNYGWAGCAGQNSVSNFLVVSGIASTALATWKQTGSINIVSCIPSVSAVDAADFSFIAFNN